MSSGPLIPQPYSFLCGPVVAPLDPKVTDLLHVEQLSKSSET